jgi:hypothetical protein
MAIPDKPWPVAVFEEQRPHLTKFVRESIVPLLDDSECRRIVLRAPVKCGKREMVEYIAMRGVATVVCTGTEYKKSLRAYKSMYGE